VPESVPLAAGWAQALSMLALGLGGRLAGRSHSSSRRHGRPQRGSLPGA